jgi:hypothetical protein
MVGRVNMADPSYEPSDDELRQLSREAFSGVPAANREAQAKLRREIRALREAPMPQPPVKTGA